MLCLQAGVPAAELAQVARLRSRDAHEAVGIGEMRREHAELGLEVSLGGVSRASTKEREEAGKAHQLPGLDGRARRRCGRRPRGVEGGGGLVVHCGSVRYVRVRCVLCWCYGWNRIYSVLLRAIVVNAVGELALDVVGVSCVYASVAFSSRRGCVWGDNRGFWWRLVGTLQVATLLISNHRKHDTYCKCNIYIIWRAMTAHSVFF